MAALWYWYLDRHDARPGARATTGTMFGITFLAQGFFFVLFSLTGFGRSFFHLLSFLSNSKRCVKIHLDFPRQEYLLYYLFVYLFPPPIIAIALPVCAFISLANNIYCIICLYIYFPCLEYHRYSFFVPESCRVLCGHFASLSETGKAEVKQIIYVFDLPGVRNTSQASVLTKVINTGRI